MTALPIDLLRDGAPGTMTLSGTWEVDLSGVIRLDLGDGRGLLLRDTDGWISPDVIGITVIAA